MNHRAGEREGSSCRGKPRHVAWGILAGLVIIGVLAAAVPAMGAAGSPAILGQANNAAGKVTTFVSRNNLKTIKIINLKPTGVPLELVSAVSQPPMRVNSSVKVLNLNADTVDDRSADQLKSLWTGCSNDNIAGGQDWTCTTTVTIPRSGALLFSGSVDLFNAGATADRVWCRFYVDGTVIASSDRDVTVDAGEYGACAADAWYQRGPGTYQVAFSLEGVGGTTQPGQGAFWVLFVPS